MKRKIVKIVEEICNGCGDCIPNCHEGALQIIDGKARLVSELMCDGLGTCLGHCPLDAISIEEREAEAYNEVKVMEEMRTKGKNTVIAHMKHLKEHGEHIFLKEAVSFLMFNKNKLLFTPEEVISELQENEHRHVHNGGCPGSKTISFEKNNEEKNSSSVFEQKSELKQWPIQLHLVNPIAPYFCNADLLIAADCIAFSMGNFHSKYLKSKSLAVACPKLDTNQEIYKDKIVKMIDEAKVNTITVMIMEVPCCDGLLRLVQNARQEASRKIPVKSLVVSLRGEILSENRV